MKSTAPDRSKIKPTRNIAPNRTAGDIPKPSLFTGPLLDDGAGVTGIGVGSWNVEDGAGVGEFTGIGVRAGVDEGVGVGLIEW